MLACLQRKSAVQIAARVGPRIGRQGGADRQATAGPRTARSVRVLAAGLERDARADNGTTREAKAVSATLGDDHLPRGIVTRANHVPPVCDSRRR